MKYYLFVIPILLCSHSLIGQNLIPNPGFENNGQLDCSSWYDACGQELTYLCDTTVIGDPCDVKFQQDVPPGGGNWSIAVTGIGNSPASTATTYVAGQEGTHTYQLSAWMKDAGNGWGGVNIGVRSKGKYTLSKTLPADSTKWAFFELTDTLKLQPKDSIEVTLWAFAAGPSFGDIDFDEVGLFVLDTLSATGDIDRTPSPQVTLFPNPAKNIVNLIIQDELQEHTICLYDLSGRLIQNQITNDFHLSFDISDVDKGLYFYRVERTKGGQRVGQGRFIVQ